MGNLIPPSRLALLRRFALCSSVAWLPLPKSFVATIAGSRRYFRARSVILLARSLGLGYWVRQHPTTGLALQVFIW